ncbi:hypothetical protein GOP47_0023200 [Adiantum capillus-veneris]|uniref:DYW domain-containing protein n=1 Tax=Adiantum capillus-veneris TaxID=13818 RepID=A0A9D4U6X4_ADICA|nr:hypothetical protein GOP47_0023200 [Adiantum capillus-veneris]
MGSQCPQALAPSSVADFSQFQQHFRLQDPSVLSLPPSAFLALASSPASLISEISPFSASSPADPPAFCRSKPGQLAFSEGKEQDDAGQGGPDEDNFRASFQIRKLASSGHLEEVNEVFRSLLQPDAYAWSAVISAYSNFGCDYAQALEFYHEMINTSVVPDGHVLLEVLRACSNLLDLGQGMHTHSCILKYGLDSDVYLGNALVSMYAKLGNLDCACLVFKKLMHRRDVVSWSTLIQAYMEHGYSFEAYDLLDHMQQEGVQPNEFTLVCLLKACSNIGEVEYGERIHSFVIEHGFECNLFIGNTLMDMYVKCDSLERAQILLSKLLKWDVLTWSIIMGGFAGRGLFQETLEAFKKMQENGVMPDEVSYVYLAKACQSLESLRQGSLAHSLIVESGLELHPLVGGAVVEMYIRCRSLEDACAMFSRLPKHDLSILNVLLSGYGQNGLSQKAYQIFLSMEQEGIEPDNVTFESLIRACSISGDLEQGKQVHCRLVKFGIESWVRIGNALIDMYSECGFFEEAYELFDESSELDVVTWNILISWLAHTRQVKEAMFYFERMQHEGFLPNQVTWNALIGAQFDFEGAIQLFGQMQQGGIAPNEITFVCILQKCCRSGCLEQGMQLHSDIVKVGLDVELVVQNTLIDMYAKNNCLETACLVFGTLTKRDVITWNVLIAGHTMHNHAQESFNLFQRMQQDGVDPDRATYVGILQACSSIATLEHGRQIHNLLIDRGLELDLHVGNTLIDFYTKCGEMEYAHVVLNRLPERDEVTWSTIISGHAKHCDYALACQCFSDMQSERLEPTGGVFLSVLSACSHACLLDNGCFYFRLMQQDHGIVPSVDHFMVLVELFGKVGCLKEAEDLLETLPWISNTVGWMTLLGSCKKRGSVELARQCFDHLMKARSKSSSGFVLLSNVYAHAGLEEAVDEIVSLRKRADTWKQPARAYIEIDNQVHDFVVGDTSHSRSEEIYSTLTRINTELKEAGYRPHVALVQRGSSLEQKEKSLWAHSEKLAVALGLLSTPEGTTIRVAKNLRVCADCHDVAKLISRKERRDIIIKDSHCLHHFKDGDCCCKEFD